ncbi:hypothetical protein LSAT2_001722 [Lamellibrachia satsuma]|nr:hypothetical protein LSAT2_001722 [Lamellibrachia satsuma]
MAILTDTLLQSRIDDGKTECSSIMGNNQRKHDKHVSQQHDEVDVEKEKLEKRFLNLLPTEQPGAALTKQIFQEKLLSACVAYSNALFDYIATQNASGSQEQLTLQMKDYVKTGKDIMRLMNFPQQTAFFFKLFSHRKGSLNREEGLLMLHTCCTLAYYCAGVTSLNLATDDLFLVAMWNSLLCGTACCSNWVDFIKSGCEKSWAEVQADSFSFECRGCARMKELEVELEELRLLVVAMVGREQGSCASSSGGGTVDDKVGKDTRGARESSPQPGRKLRGGKVIGRRDTGRKQTERKGTGGKTTGVKERGVGETGGKEKGVGEMGGKTTGVKERGVGKTRAKEREVWETGAKETGWKGSGQNVMEGIERKSYSAAVIEGVRKRATVFVGDSIVRKTDRVLNKGDDVVVCLPGVKIEAITESVENIVGSATWNSLVRSLAIIDVFLVAMWNSLVRSLATIDLFLVAVWNSLCGGEEVVPVETATSWCSRHCPGIWDAIHLCTRLALFGGHSIGQEGAAPNPTLLQILEGGEYILSLPMLWVLSTILPSVYIPPSQVTGDQGKSAFGSHLPLSNIVAGTSFHLMYSSNEHGLSTNR